MAIFRCRKLCMVRNFYDIINNAFFLQYFALSLPSCSIRNGNTLVINEKTAMAELIITHLILIPQFGVIAYLKGFTLSLDLFHVLFWVMNLSSMCFLLVTGYELKAKVQAMKSIFDKIRSLDGVIKLERGQLKSLTAQQGLWSLGIVFTVLVTIGLTLTSSQSFLLKLVLVVGTLRIHVQPVAILLQFFSLITLVRLYLEWVDKQLSNMRNRIDGEKDDCAPFTTFRSHFREIGDCKTACKIEKIRKIYGQVNDLKREINEMYSLRLWSDTVNTILQILFFIYTNLLMLQRNDGLLKGDALISFHYLVFWIAFLTLKFSQSVSICGRVAECGKIIGTSVHQLFSRSHCESVRQELTSFSLELLHRDPYIRAYKFFEIDYPLTAGVVRGILMQLIALMQINIPDSSDTDEFIKFMSPKKEEDAPVQPPALPNPAMTNLTFKK